jgi:two-component sensor histidine kinase/CHASE1-domain containing sensor protein
MGGHRIRRWLLNYPRATPLALFLLVAAVTALSVFAIERGERESEAALLRERAQTIGSAIERRANAASAYLRAGAALFSTQETIPQRQFREFVDELRLDADYRGAEGIGWARAVDPRGIGAFEEAMAGQTPGTLRVFPQPAPGTRLVVAVTFLHPDTQRNRRALCFDMYSEPERRAAMDAAVRNLQPTASGRVVLAQEQPGSDAPGFIIYMPVFDRFGPGRQLRGFIYSPFNADDFLEAALRSEEGVANGIRLYDGELGAGKVLAEVRPEAASGSRTATQRLVIANRPMTLEVEAPRNTSLSDLSMLTLLFGLLVASLLMVVVRLLTQQVKEDQASLDWLEEQNSIRDSLTRELNHRVKNSLANVLSIISLTRRRAEDVDDFADGLEGRVRALSATHDLLTNSQWGMTALRDVVEIELQPYLGDNEHTVELSGPPVELAPNDALSLGLAVHELATNAAKFGALSQRGGRVSVTWEMLGDGTARLVWQETGGPPVSLDRTRGFGTDLLEKVVAHEFSRPIEIEFAPEGVRCVLTVPVRRQSDFAIRARYRIT